MSKIARYAGNLPAFASNAQGLERTVFGGTAQADDLTSQITDAFRRGWGVVGPSENPSLEDFNGAFYTLSQLISYQHQMGVPEWDAKQEYYLGSICSYKGEMYESLSNSNTGNEPPSAQWTLVITAKNGLSKLGLGTAAKKDVGTGPSQIPDMSFFPTYGTTNGYFKLPNGLILQWGQSATITKGAETSVSYYIPFPNQCFQVIGLSCGTPKSAVLGSLVTIDSTVLSASGFTAYYNNGSAPTLIFRYVAIGY